MSKASTLGFSIFIDKEMNELFSLFCILFSDFEEQAKKEKFEDYKIIEARKTFDRFIEVMAGPVHELGWCNDPTCTWKEDQKKN